MVNDSSAPSSQGLPPMFGEPHPGPVTDDAAPVPPPPPPPVVRPPAGDRPWLNLIWDGVLFVLVAGGVLAMVVIGVDLGGPEVLGVGMLSMLPILLLAMALGVTLRAGAVNFAVGHLAGIAVVLYAALQPMGELWALLGAVGGGVVGSLVIAVAVTLLRAPAWAVGLFVIVGTMAGADMVRTYMGFPEESPHFEFDPALAWLVVAGVVFLSIVGGAVAMLPPARRLLYRTSHSVESTGTQTAGTVLTVFATQLIAGLLAAAAGLLTLVPGGISLSAAAVQSQGLLALGAALGIVLLGGTSLRGGRGGVAGTVLAALLVFAASELLRAQGDPVIVTWALPLGVLLLGVIVSRVLGGGRRIPPTEQPIEPVPVFAAAPPIYEPQPDGLAPVSGPGFAQQLPDGLALPESNVATDVTPTQALPGMPGDAAEQQYWPPAEPTSDTPTLEVPAAPDGITSADARETSTEPPTLPQQTQDPYQYRPPAQ
ncbi:hypothetical protein ACFQ3B_12850 [Stackebrandtia endophytica]|nr:hypothetical protein [Stackebrandtia endophytica]